MWESLSSPVTGLSDHLKPPLNHSYFIFLSASKWEEAQAVHSPQDFKSQQEPRVHYHGRGLQLEARALLGCLLTSPNQITDQDTPEKDPANSKPCPPTPAWVKLLSEGLAVGTLRLPTVGTSEPLHGGKGTGRSYHTCCNHGQQRLSKLPLLKPMDLY